jgi:hypothetical protein
MICPPFVRKQPWETAPASFEQDVYRMVSLSNKALWRLIMTNLGNLGEVFDEVDALNCNCLLQLIDMMSISFNPQEQIRERSLPCIF